MYGRLISQWPDPDRLLGGAAETTGWVERLSASTEGLAPVARMRARHAELHARRHPDQG
jgi:hypothetical protein